MSKARPSDSLKGQSFLTEGSLFETVEYNLEGVSLVVSWYLISTVRTMA